MHLGTVSWYLLAFKISPNCFPNALEALWDGGLPLSIGLQKHVTLWISLDLPVFEAGTVRASCPWLCLFQFCLQRGESPHFWEMCSSSDTLTVIIFPFCHCFLLICTATCVTSWVRHDLPWVNPCCWFPVTT